MSTALYICDRAIVLREQLGRLDGPARRQEIARKAAAARWPKKDKPA